MVINMTKHLLRYIKVSIISSPIWFVLSILMIIIFRLAQLGMDYSLKYVTDILVNAQVNQSKYILYAFIIFFLLMCIGGNTGNFTNLMDTLYTNKAKKLFSKYFMFRAYEEKQDRFYDNQFYDNYEFVKKNIDNTTKINSILFNKLFSQIVSVIISVISIAYFSPYILLLISVVSIMVVFINRFIVKKRIEIDEKYMNDERRVQYFSSLLSDKAHAKELRIFMLKNYFWSQWNKSFRKYSEQKYQFEKKAMLLSNMPGFIEKLLSTVLVLYFLYAVSSKEIQVGDFVFLYRIMWRLTWGITGVIGLLTSDFAQSYAYIKKYDTYVDRFQMKKVKDMQPNSSREEKTLIYGEFSEMTLNHVTYSYPAQEGRAVDDVSFHIKKGEVVSILGYNGSGKSTLSKLMCGLLENYNGSIKINGYDISDMSREDVYQYFGIGFQDFTKYSISLKDNVGIGMIEKITEKDKIEKAIKKGNLQSIIDRLPKGENTILSKEYDSEGQDLSGGQWQRVILSRAYMGEPEIMILDEPTASVDPIEEMRMLSHFKDIVQGKTALLISHRIGFARLSNRICMMDKGHIIEIGTHEELLARRGRYYDLYMSQKHLYEEEEATVNG